MTKIQQNVYFSFQTAYELFALLCKIRHILKLTEETDKDTYWSLRYTGLNDPWG